MSKDEFDPKGELKHLAHDLRVLGRKERGKYGLTPGEQIWRTRLLLREKELRRLLEADEEKG